MIRSAAASSIEFSSQMLAQREEVTAARGLACRFLRRFLRLLVVRTPRYLCPRNLWVRQAHNPELRDRPCPRPWLASHAAERSRRRDVCWRPHGANPVFCLSTLRRHGRCGGDESGGKQCDDRCLYVAVLSPWKKA